MSTDGDWLDLVGDLLAVPTPDMPVERIALQLVDTFQGTACSWTGPEADGVLHGRLYPLDEPMGGHRAFIERWGPRASPRFHPVLLQWRATGRIEVAQIADVPDRFVEPPARGVWQSVARNWGGAQQVSLPLPGGAAFVVGSTTAFTPVAMDLARRLQRLLAGLDRQGRALAGRVPPTADAGRTLTGRQLAVLALLAEGLTAAAIGRRLGISERTVHKHLEHVYARLGVRDRLSAVLAARREGLLC